jgi:hypothetical protein
MKKPANGRVNQLDNKKGRPRRLGASASGETGMDKGKGNGPSMQSSKEHILSSDRFGKLLSNSSLGIQDKRVTRLLSLLHQLDKSAGGLGALPAPELDEVLSSAVRLSGFSNPIEARDVTASVLEGLKTQNPTPDDNFG